MVENTRVRSLSKAMSEIVCCSSVAKLCLFVTPWTAAHQASLSFTTSRSLLKFMCIELVMPSNYLIFCCPLLLLPWIFPTSGSFPVSQFFISGGPKYWSFSFSISPSNEYSGLISFRIDWFDLLGPRDSQESSPAVQCKSINSLALSLMWTCIYHYIKLILTITFYKR